VREHGTGLTFVDRCDLPERAEAVHWYNGFADVQLCCLAEKEEERSLSCVDVSVFVNKYRSLCCCAAGTLRSMCVCVRAAIVRRICGLRLWWTDLPMKGRV
jgi:hypothetical protein